MLHHPAEAQTPAQDDPGQQALDRAIGLAAGSIGELMHFWGFKPSMGKIWCVLYLSQQPLDAQEITARTGLSAGSVSMTLNDLQLWRVIKRSAEPGGRRKQYVAETDIWQMVTHVFRERELKKVRESIAHLTRALDLAEHQARSSQPETMLRSRFVATRLRLLLELSRTGERMLERLSQSGEVDLAPLRNWLRAFRRRPGRPL